MRKLASVKKIAELMPIAGKDRIELARVDGWQVIVKKNEFAIDDLVVFCEPDSVLPDEPAFEFLRKGKFRIKTMKMGGVLSQGIIFPMSLLPKGKYSVDDDVTDAMKIVQYSGTQDAEPVEKETYSKNKIVKYLLRYGIFRKIFSKKRVALSFPSFVGKTDETRVQNIPWVLNSKDILWSVTEKLDGQSATFFLRKTGRNFFTRKPKYDFGVCSRNLRLREDDSNYWKIARKYKLEEKLLSLIGAAEFVAIQGEIVGPGIQKNKYKLKEIDFYAFNYKTNLGRTSSEFGMSQVGPEIKWVPILYQNMVLPDTVGEILELATGKSVIGDCLREGLVFRSAGIISFKAVSPDFLIKNDE